MNSISEKESVSKGDLGGGEPSIYCMVVGYRQCLAFGH